MRPEPPPPSDVDAPLHLRPVPDDGLEGIYLGPAELSRERSDTRTPGADDVPAPTRLGLVPVAQLLAEEIPPIEWAVPDYVERGAIAAIVAPPNVGKTLLAVHWLVQAALRGERVALVEEEGGRRGLQKRLSRAINAAGGLAAIHAAGGEVLLAIKPRLSLMSAQDVAALATELVGCSLVVVDSLARVTSGLEENDSSEMSRIVDALDYIRTHARISLVVIHHSGKQSWKPGQAPSIGDGRGSSALAGGLDAIVHLSPVPPSERLDGYVSALVYATKQRDAECARPMRFSVQMTGPAAYVEMVEVEGATIAQKEGIEGAVMAYLLKRDEPVTRTEITESVVGATPRIRAAIDALIDCGDAVVVTQGRYSYVRAAPSRPAGRAAEPPEPPPYGIGGGTDGRLPDSGGRAGRNWQDGRDEP